MKTRIPVVKILIDFDGLKGRTARVVERTKFFVTVEIDGSRRIVFTRREVSAQKMQ